MTPASANARSEEKFDELSINGFVKSTTSGKKVAGRNSVNLGGITTHNVLQLKKLNQAVFPITYNDKFYTEVTTAGELAKLAYFNDVVVGAVCCRFEKLEEERSLYIMTLGTLAPYRQFGIGKLLLSHVFQLCRKDPTVKNVFLHVQVNNTTALNFYKNNGFKDLAIIEDYYRLEPSDAYLLVKQVNQSD